MYPLQAQPKVQPMCPHEDSPEGDDLGGYDPEGEVDEVGPALKALSARLTKILKHAHLDQGLLAIDLIQALHQVQGQVISWGMVEALEEQLDGDDEDEDDPQVVSDDGVITPGWTPASDATSEDDEPDVDDQGDPRMRV